MLGVPIRDQIKCLTEELERRKRRLPQLVADGRMTQERAAAEIARMDAARQTLTQLAGLVGAS